MVGTLSDTPGDYRTVKNEVAALRRNGVNLPGRNQPKRRKPRPRLLEDLSVIGYELGGYLEQDGQSLIVFTHAILEPVLTPAKSAADVDDAVRDAQRYLRRSETPAGRFLVFLIDRKNVGRRETRRVPVNLGVMIKKWNDAGVHERVSVGTVTAVLRRWREMPGARLELLGDKSSKHRSKYYLVRGNEYVLHDRHVHPLTREDFLNRIIPVPTEEEPPRRLRLSWLRRRSPSRPLYAASTVTGARLPKLRQVDSQRR